MDKNKIIDKIQKCLRLGESGNPNEAAAALRQAHGLMRKYSIAESEVQARQIGETSAASGGYYNPPYWSVALAELVAEAFVCAVYVARRVGYHPQFRFIGLEQSARVAAYTFTVLYRQLRQARRTFMHDLGIPDKQEARRQGNVFAQAWLYRIAQVVSEFVGDPDTRAVIDDYVEKNYADAAESLRNPTDPQARDYEVILSGLRAAHAVSLLRPVQEGDRQKQLADACA